MSIVYRHRTANTHEVFYVGIGTTTKRAYAFARSRNAYWTNVYKKHGVIVEIVAEDISWDKACELEKLMIQEYGRREFGTGCLVNMTDGGDGQANPSKETIAKMSAAKYGKKASEETKKKMSAYQTGKIKIKPVVDLMTGFFYDNLTEACKATNQSFYAAYHRQERKSKKVRFIYV